MLPLPSLDSWPGLAWQCFFSSLLLDGAFGALAASPGNFGSLKKQVLCLVFPASGATALPLQTAPRHSRRGLSEGLCWALPLAETPPSPEPQPGSPDPWVGPGLLAGVVYSGRAAAGLLFSLARD